MEVGNGTRGMRRGVCSPFSTPKTSPLSLPLSSYRRRPVQQRVVQLQVSVRDAQVMAVGDRPAKLDEQETGGVARQDTAAGGRLHPRLRDVARQRPARRVLHDEADVRRRQDGLVDFDEVDGGHPQLRLDACLPQHDRQHLPGQGLPLEQLDGDEAGFGDVSEEPGVGVGACVE